MGAESVIQGYESPIVDIRKPGKVGPLDVIEIAAPPEQNLDLANAIASLQVMDLPGKVSEDVEPVVSVDDVPFKDASDNLETDGMEEVSLEEDRKQNTLVSPGISEPETQPSKHHSKPVEIIVEQNTPLVHEIIFGALQPSMDDSKPVESSVEQNTAIVDEVTNAAPQSSADDIKSVEGSLLQSTLVAAEDQISQQQSSTTGSKPAEQIIMQITAAVPAEFEPLVSTDESKVVESESEDKTPALPAELDSQAGSDESKIVESSKSEDKTPPLPAGPLISPTTSRFARGLENQEVQAEPATPPTPERNGTVIRITRQMSRVSSSMGPISPRLEIRAAKEIQELQDKVKFLEAELRTKSTELETQSSLFKEKENELMDKIDCLELANEQLLQGGNDSSIQLQMELTRLQRQNSVLSLRERELQFQINIQESLKSDMLEKRLSLPDPTTPTKKLESKIALLESKLAEAVEVSNMYKLQLHEAFEKQKNVQSAALLNLNDGDDVLKEFQKLRKQIKELEAELQDMQDRFFLVSVRLAEADAQKEELLMKMKRIQGLK